MLWVVVAVVVAVVSNGTNLVAGDAASCTFELQEAAAVGIHNSVNDLVDASVRSLRSYANQAKLFRPYMDGSPKEINSDSNKAQTSMYNIAGYHNDVWVYGGWEDNGFVGYFAAGDGEPLTISYQEPNDPGPETNGSNDYTINIKTGESFGESIRFDSKYACTTRPWYMRAKSLCPADMNGYYDCPVIMTDLYVSVFDNAITLTAALGMPNWQGKRQLNYLDNTMPYGGQGDGSNFSGVIAADVACNRFNEILKKAVEGNVLSVAYIVENDLKLVAVSDGSTVASIKNAYTPASRVEATTSPSRVIRDSANYIKINRMFSDNVVVWTDNSGEMNTITVKKYFKNDLSWYIVTVAPFDASVASMCDYKVLSSTLQSIVHSVDTQLSYAVHAAEFISGTIKFGLFDGATISPSADDLWKLGESATDVNAINLQNALIATGLTFKELSMIYVAYPNNVFVAYTFTGEGEFKRFSYSAADSDDSKGHYTAPLTGYASNPTSRSPEDTNNYVPSQRPWYKTAKAAKKGSWSSPYVFATAHVVGVTYSVPVYGDDGTLLAVVGVDIKLSDVTNALEKHLRKFHASGDVFYIMETAQSPPPATGESTSAYKLLATSSDANVISSDGKTQNYATDTEVDDAIITTSADYMKYNKITSDGNFKTGTDDSLHATVMNYQNWGLYWRFVGVSYQYPNPDASKSTVPAKPQPNNDINMSDDSTIDRSIMKLSIAVLCVVVFQLLLSTALLPK